MEHTMCDFSNMAKKRRDAVAGDKLTVHDFGNVTHGFKGVDDKAKGAAAVAVCVLPGTEIAFAAPIVVRSGCDTPPPANARVATFTQVDKDQEQVHHDALEFPNGAKILLTDLAEGQRATIVTLPAEPTTPAEREFQRRAAYVG